MERLQHECVNMLFHTSVYLVSMVMRSIVTNKYSDICIRNKYIFSAMILFIYTRMYVEQSVCVTGYLPSAHVAMK